MEHLAVRALELLPVLLRREDLVDALEGLEEARVEIERLVEELDGAILVVQLVAIELRHRVDVAWLLRSGCFSMSAMRWSVSTICVPVAASPGRAASSLWRSDVVLRLEIERLFEGLDAPSARFFSLSIQMSPISIEHLEALVAVDDVVEDLPLVGGDLLPVLELGVDADQRFERRPVRGVDAERLLEVVDRLLGLALLLLDAAELVVDVGALLGLVLAERGEHLLVVGERARPVLQAEAHVGEAADRLLVGEIELVRGLVGLERLVVLAERREHLAEHVL